MPEPTHPTTALVALLRMNDPNAANALLAHTQDRLRQLARRMLQKYPQVGHWEQDDDIHQKALIRIWNRVTRKAPKSGRHFWNLASRILQHVLIEAARQYRGPQGFAANHHPDPGGLTLATLADTCDGPMTLAHWTEFHQVIRQLPDDLREVFGLLYYQEMTQDEAAEVIGTSVQTIRRRWQEARMVVGWKIGNQPPGVGNG